MDKLYLGEILKVDNYDVLELSKDKNVLIVAPVGSGKTYYIQNELCNDDRKRYLYLCDTKNLKDQQLLLGNTCNSKGEIAKVINDKIEMTRKYFGKRNVITMTYEEFGHRVRYDVYNEFIQTFDMVIADEIHNLIKYQNFDNSSELHTAFLNMLKKYEKTSIVFLTATPYKLDSLIEKHKGLDSNFIRIDYKEDKRIKRYISLVTDTYSHYKQIPTIIEEKYKQGIIFLGYKILIYVRTIETMKIIENNLKEIEYLQPICLWSINEDTQNKYTFTNEQFKVRDYLIVNGELIEPYNVLIINASMETGVNIYDKKMMYCIINSTNEDEQIQVRGRIRRNIIESRLKQDKTFVTKDLYNIDEKWLNRPLTKEDKDALCEELNIYDSTGRLAKWTTIKKLLEKNGFEIKSCRPTINGKRVSCHKIIKICQ